MKTSLLFKKLCQHSGGSILLPSEPEKTVAAQGMADNFLHRKTFQPSATGAGCSRHPFARDPAWCFTAFARQCFSRLAVVRLLPVARLVLACVAFVASSIAASACGISWSLPRTPMDSEYRFQYWEKLGQVTVGEARLSGTTKIPLHLGFKPSTPFPSLLGVSWSLPIFESRMEWQGADSAKLFLPDGQTETIKRMRENKQRLRGSGWIAEISGRQITCKASCGWVLVFLDNRLKTMKTPEGDTLEIVIGQDRSRNLCMGARVLVSLKPDFDKKTTQKIYRLKFADQMLLLAMGQRPVPIREGKKPEKIVRLESLIGYFQEVSSSEQKFIFGKDTLAVSERKFKWNPQNGELLQDGEFSFEKQTIEGLRCLKTINGKGEYELKGEDWGRRIRIDKAFHNPSIFVSKYYPVTKGRIDDKPQVYYRIKPNGEKEIDRQYWYDENLNVMRVFIRDGDRAFHVFKTNENTVKILNEKKEFLSQITYDKQARIEAVEGNGSKIEFFYKGDNVHISINQKGNSFKRVIKLDALHPFLSNFLPVTNPLQTVNEPDQR